MVKALKTVDDLTPDARNANKGTVRGRAMIEQSIRECGAGRSIVVDREGRVIGGNKTLEVVEELGLPVVVVPSDGKTLVVVQRTDLDLETDPKARRLAYLDNRTTDVDLEWDAEAIAADLEAGVELGDLFKVEELGAILEDAASALLPEEELDAQIDKANELQQRWGTARGQLWEIPSKACAGRSHWVMCGDSTSGDDVKTLLRGDAPPTVIFDPPYDAADCVLDLRWPCNDALVFTDHRHLLDCIDGWGRFRCQFVWDTGGCWYVPGWPLLGHKSCLWFGETPYSADGSLLTWGDNRPTASVVANSRGRYVYKPNPDGKHLSTVYRASLVAEHQRSGSAQYTKPLEWMRALIANCTTGDVFDPFIGSGTSVVACEAVGRLCAGSEVDPAMAAVTLQRLADLGLDPRQATD